MSNDRELLELAAKANFGEGNFEWNSCAGFSGTIQHIPVGCRRYVDWNPLTDDGDALRLAVKLEMQLRILHRDNEVSVYGSPDGRVDESVHGDPFAATRRAIVRAAAEIGRAMP